MNFELQENTQFRKFYCRYDNVRLIFYLVEDCIMFGTVSEISHPETEKQFIYKNGNLFCDGFPELRNILDEIKNNLNSNSNAII